MRIKKDGAPLLFAMSLLLTLLAAAPARADYPDDNFGIDDVSLGGRATYMMPKTGPNYWDGGAQLRFWGDVFGLEGSIDDHYDTIGTTKVNQYPVQVSLLARLIPGCRISPFLLGGAGWYYTSFSGPGVSDTTNIFGVHAGAGLEIFLNHTWSIDGTWRYLWLQTHKVTSAAGAPSDFDGSGQMVTLALNLHF